MQYTAHLRFLCLCISILLLAGCGIRITDLEIMEPGERIDQPPPGKALVNVHRPSDYGQGDEYVVWRDLKVVGCTYGKDMFQVVVDPGEQIFHAISYRKPGDGLSVIIANLQAGKIYDLVCDSGVHVTLGPLAVPFYQYYNELHAIQSDEKRCEEIPTWLAQEKTLVISEKGEDLRLEYEAKKTQAVLEYLEAFTAGKKKHRAEILSPEDGR